MRQAFSSTWHCARRLRRRCSQSPPPSSSASRNGESPRDALGCQCRRCRERILGFSAYPAAGGQESKHIPARTVRAQRSSAAPAGSTDRATCLQHRLDHLPFCCDRAIAIVGLPEQLLRKRIDHHVAGSGIEGDQLIDSLPAGIAVRFAMPPMFCSTRPRFASAKYIWSSKGTSGAPCPPAAISAGRKFETTGTPIQPQSMRLRLLARCTRSSYLHTLRSPW